MVCGDTMEAFRTDSGLWCLLLADGMGSGDAARRESSLTCRLLRQFLEADIQPEAALTTLNSAMALRGAETGSFTTVDLCVLKGSEATFYKFGAAPSYLKKNGAVRRITGSSLPVGMYRSSTSHRCPMGTAKNGFARNAMCRPNASGMVLGPVLQRVNRCCVPVSVRQWVTVMAKGNG